MRQIPVGSDHFALVDDEDYDDLVRFRWHLLKTHSRSVYAMRDQQTNGQRIHELMHRRIMKVDVDHQNGNGLDNRRSNLRPATNSQNNANKSKQRGVYTSTFKGVYWYRRTGRWVARIEVRGKQIWLGYHASEEEAAMAYDRAAIHYFGEFAYTNFRDSGDSP